MDAVAAASYDPVHERPSGRAAAASPYEPMRESSESPSGRLPSTRSLSAPSTPRGEGSRRQFFSEAERRIVQAGKEVAQKVVDIERAEQDVKLRQQATIDSWNRTQQREDRSRQQERENQHARADLGRAASSISAEA